MTKNDFKIEKKITVKKMNSQNTSNEDLKFWLSKTEEDRILAVEFYRRQYYGALPRLQRVITIIKQK